MLCPISGAIEGSNICADKLPIGIYPVNLDPTHGNFLVATRDHCIKVTSPRGNPGYLNSRGYFTYENRAFLTDKSRVSNQSPTCRVVKVWINQHFLLKSIIRLDLTDRYDTEFGDFFSNSLDQAMLFFCTVPA